MRKKIDLLVLLAVLVIGAVAVVNAQALGDWWHARSYSPSPEIVQLAEAAGMSDKGKQLFYRFSPRLVGQQELDNHCDIEKLGCAEGRSIYILQSNNDEEYNRNVVTAAHEMLHIAYSRLNSSEQAALETLLKAELAKPEATDLLTQLKDYPTEDYYNEAHSFIGSESAEIDSALENHYDQYFADRSRSVAAYDASPER